ncbi:glycerophosphodiester phosphodiesterase [Nocardioides daejeonensis]|uniref:glycerophosphodiester phosphodiesterase n=1 Tax=Nocardioides daejeonensis TaxID=1046556 RepID=UPI0013A5989C|nr:glycerophosphodiester phosphodiesterase [Nocardioides daejeonensis]
MPIRTGLPRLGEGSSHLVEPSDRLVPQLLLSLLTTLLALQPTLLPAGGHAAEPLRVRPADFRVVGHRGDPGPGITENTIEALRRADRAGAHGSEFDVRLTADRRIVLMHDPSLRRTTTCTVRVDRARARWLRRHCRGRHRERVPSLDDALAWMHRNHQQAVIEIKDGRGWRADDLSTLAHRIRRHGMRRQSTVISFSLSALRRLERQDPTLRTGWIGTRWSHALSARRAGLDVIHVPARVLTRSRVTRLHRDGLTVIGRVTNDPRQWRRLRRIGADGLVTDRPGDVRRHLR